MQGQASALAGAMRLGALAGTFFAPTNEAVAALLDAESLKMAALVSNSSLVTQAGRLHVSAAYIAVHAFQGVEMRGQVRTAAAWLHNSASLPSR